MSLTKPKPNRIILNVGGIKYETFRSTLLSLPESFLGTMFKDENEQMEKLENGNELFLDRNGRAFYYILEFYRSRKFFWSDHYEKCDSSEHVGCCFNMITREEIQAEIDFFLVPIELPEPSPPVIEKPDPYVEMLNKFINMLENFISTAKGVYIERINVTLPCHERKDFFLHPNTKMLEEILNPFSDCGFRLMENYGEKIANYLEKNDETLKFASNIEEKGWANAKCIITIEIKLTKDIDSIITKSILSGLTDS